MNLAEISVRRPVTTMMFYLGIILLGLISVFKLPQALYPQITFPQLTVMTKYGNAAPEEVETLITKIIEEAVGTVNNIKRITSKSKEGVSLVTAEFSWNTNMDFAALSMREKIDLIKARLPRDAGEPIVMKFNPLELPVLILSVTGDRDDVSMLRFARRQIKESLEKLEGVAACTISGGIDREIHVNVDQARLLASGVAINEITDALNNDNLNYPAGTIKDNFFEYLIRSIGEYKDVDEIKNVSVGLDDRDDQKRNKEPGTEYMSENVDPLLGAGLGKRLILLKDVAMVEDGTKERTSYSRYNHENNISLSVQKQATANVIEIASRVKKELKTIAETIPEDVRVEVIYDQSVFIKNAIKGVGTAIWQGGLIAFLVLLYFLKSFRSALIVGVAIPISVLITFSLMFFKGLSLNMMSLSGLALGIGMMVDNAIVVIENISRLRVNGKKPKESAIDGTNEVGTAVVASTLTTIAVFLPIGFVIGIVGQMFKDLSFTVNFALIASLLVALTLIPRLSVGEQDYQEEQKKQHWLISVLEYPFLLIVHLYEVLIHIFLKLKYIFLFLLLGFFCLTMFWFFRLDKEMMPKIDQGEFIVKVTMPTGTLLHITDEVCRRLEGYIETLPEVESINSQIGSDKGDDNTADVIDGLGSHEGQLTVTLKKEREEHTKFTIQKIRRHIRDWNVGRAQIEYVVTDTGLGGIGSGGGGAPIVLEVKGPQLPKLRQITEALEEKMAQIPGMFGVKNDFAMPSPETKVTVKKDKAALYGMSVTDISQAAQISLKGSVATKFKENGREYDVLVRLREEDRDSFGKLRNIMVRSKTTKQILPLSDVASLSRGMGPSEIVRKDQQRTITVFSDIFDRGLEAVLMDVQKVIEKMRPPNEYEILIAGESEQMKASFRSMQMALALSILLVYMIMASQFESLWQPFIIMFTVPMALIGVTFALYLTGTTLNVMVILGIIMLAGIVVNNAIVLITCANDLRAMGESAYDAAVEAGKLRLRPILMTTLTTVLGLIPMSLGLSEGSEMQTPMAKTVMGGLTVATILTLFVIPALYLISENLMDRLFKRERVVITDSGAVKIST